MKIGEAAKAHFPGESMWLQVTGLVNDGFIGRLDNHPICTAKHGCEYGDLIYCKEKPDFRYGFIAAAKLAEIGGF